MAGLRLKTKHNDSARTAIIISKTDTSHLNTSRLVLTVLVLIFAAVGSYLLIFSHAATSLSADFNTDGVVNVTDLSILATNWGRTSATHAQGDANSDGTINIYDLSILASQWGQVVSTGQPPNSINIKDYGATGDGVTNDTANLLTAFNAAVAQNKVAYVPAGTYAGEFNIPDSLTLVGASKDTTWLKGKLTFGSNDTISGLKIGDTGDSAVHNRNGASYTTFTDCHFRGGSPGAPDGNFSTIALGDDGSTNHITFKDSDIERNLGLGDNIGIVEDGSTSGGAHVDSITFDNDHVGVSNGRTDISRNIGGPRGGIEIWTNSNNGTALHGWSNINILNSTFEATDSFCIDLADMPLASGQRASGPVRVAGNTIKGGGWGSAQPYGYTLAIESPKGVIIENNTIYRGRDSTMGTGASSGLPSGYIIRNNIIDLSFDNGITVDSSPYSKMMEFQGDSATFSGNTVTTNVGGITLQLDQFTNGTVTGNGFNELRSSNTPWALAYGQTSNTSITGNTFRTAATTNSVLWDAGGNSNNTITPNTFLHN
ncbi:MAG TPA: glycosyl hydrolase family 28-related protein [Patescibacteria group bacterium]|nr:glycosyl hydrolase family 28-related protein [Patescibacteria group bacterium]